MNRKSENIWFFLLKKKSFSSKTRKTLPLSNKEEDYQHSLLKMVTGGFETRWCKVFIKWASLIEINWIKFGLIK